MGARAGPGWGVRCRGGQQPPWSERARPWNREWRRRRSPPSGPACRFRPGRRATGLEYTRVFAREGIDPFDEIEWDSRSAVIGNEKGEVVFEQRDVEVPKFWSQTATNIVVSKYFRGTIGTPQREKSVKQLVGRVVDTIAGWARKQRYFASEDDLQAFADDLKHLLVYQKASFNSPVWFNVGIEPHPQCSACFINSVQDTMDSILTLARTEGMLFKYGSGTGSNLSTIRSSRELLAGRRHRLGPGLVHEGLRRVRGRHQVGRQDPPRREDGDPERRPSGRRSTSSAARSRKRRRPGRSSTRATTDRSRARPTRRCSSRTRTTACA